MRTLLPRTLLPRTLLLRTLLARTCLALTCLALAGCSDLAAPTASTSTTASKLAQAQRTHEYPSLPAPAQRAKAAATSPQSAIRAFASAYINWNAGSVAADMGRLASHSVSQARSAMQLAAANTAQDYELQRGGIANAGTVEAIAPLLRSRSRYVVVTLERTTASNTTAYQGLRAEWHLTIATVTQIAPNQWVLSGWQPEN